VFFDLFLIPGAGTVIQLIQMLSAALEIVKNTISC